MIIGIAGKKGVGKDTAAKILGNLILADGKTFSIKSLADPLKKMCHGLTEQVDKDGLTNLTPKDFGERGNDPMTLRQVYQYIGTEIFRKLNQDFWLNLLLREEYTTDYLIVPDVRFYNEYNEILKRKGRILHLSRETNLTDNHQSENGLNIPIDYKNNGSLKDLENYLVKWFYE